MTKSSWVGQSLKLANRLQLVMGWVDPQGKPVAPYLRELCWQSIVYTDSLTHWCFWQQNFPLYVEHYLRAGCLLQSDDRSWQHLLNLSCFCPASVIFLCTQPEQKPSVTAFVTTYLRWQPDRRFQGLPCAQTFSSLHHSLHQPKGVTELPGVLCHRDL
jgi:hypothetical protein